MVSIDVDGLTKMFGDVTAVDDLTFALDLGSSAVMVGVGTYLFERVETV